MIRTLLHRLLLDHLNAEACPQCARHICHHHSVPARVLPSRRTQAGAVTPIAAPAAFSGEAA